MKNVIFGVGFLVVSAVLACSQAQVLRQNGELSAGDITYETGAPIDWYSASVHANHLVRVRVASVDFVPTVVVQFSDRSSDSVDGKDGSVGISYQIDQDQTIRVGVTGQKGMTLPAAYTIRIVEDSAPPPLTVGKSITGELSFDDPVLDDGRHDDTYTMPVTAGSWYGIVMTSDIIDTYLSITLPDGTQLENDDSSNGAAAIRFAPTQSGTATVTATSYSAGEIGGYTLAAANVPAPVAVKIGGSANGSLSAGDDLLTGAPVDLYILHGKAGDSVTISLHSDSFDAYLRTLDSDGQSDENDDYDGSSYDAQLTYQFSTDGDLQIEVSAASSDETGKYTLSVTANAPDNAD